MPQTVKKTLKQLSEELKQQYNTTIQAIMSELGIGSTPTFYSKLNNPANLSPAEKQVFAKHFNTSVDAIDWQEKKNFIA